MTGIVEQFDTQLFRAAVFISTFAAALIPIIYY
jgi:hypothetical protein